MKLPQEQHPAAAFAGFVQAAAGNFAAECFAGQIDLVHELAEQVSAEISGIVLLNQSHFPVWIFPVSNHLFP